MSGYLNNEMAADILAQSKQNLNFCVLLSSATNWQSAYFQNTFCLFGTVRVGTDPFQR